MCIAGVVKESIVDGPGIRYTIFTQGCPHNCEGCHNVHTHDPSGGKSITFDKILDDLKKNPLISGVTFSGGEPFMQAKELYELALLLKEKGLNILTYSGYTFEEIVRGYDENPYWKELLEITDYLIDGRFILAEKSLLLRFRGSKNQRIIDVKKSLAESSVVTAEL